MGQHQSSWQDSNIRWRDALDHDEGGYQSPALSRPYASKSANSGLPVRRRSSYPPYNLRSKAGCDSPSVHGEAVSDASTRAVPSKSFSHLQSPMGRRSLQSSGNMAVKATLGPLVESTTDNSFQGGSRTPGSRYDNLTGSDLGRKTLSPLLIRSHIKENLKPQDRGRSRLRIRRSREIGPDNTSGVSNRHATQRELTHFVPTTQKAVGNEGQFPTRVHVTSYQIPRSELPRPTPGFNENSGLDSETIPPHGVSRAMSPTRSGQQVVTTKTEGHTALQYNGDEMTIGYKSYRPLELGPIRSHAPFRPLPGPSSNQMAQRVAQQDRHASQSHQPAGEITVARASNRLFNSGSDTGDSTDDINFTISKDSSADERVRNAKLLAEMGERNQRYRGGNEVDLDLSRSQDHHDDPSSIEAKPVTDAPYMVFSEPNGFANLDPFGPRLSPPRHSRSATVRTTKMTPEQRELKRQREQTRRDSKLAARVQMAAREASKT